MTRGYVINMRLGHRGSRAGPACLCTHLSVRLFPTNVYEIPRTLEHHAATSKKRSKMNDGCGTKRLQQPSYVSADSLGHINRRQCRQHAHLAVHTDGLYSSPFL